MTDPDPLSSDEPLDMDAVLGDDRLIEAIADGADPDDALGAVLAALRDSGKDRQVIHELPVGRGERCLRCGVPIADLPDGDALAEDPDLVDCDETRPATEER